MQFSRNNCESMILVTSKLLAQFLDKVGSYFLLWKQILICLIYGAKNLTLFDC